MNVPAFPKTFLHSGRSGFYLRVLEEGEVGAGDSITLVRADPTGLTVREVNHLLHFGRADIQGARRALRMEALSPSWRATFAGRVAAAND